MNYWHFLIPLLSALTGWIRIRLFLKLIFRPRLPQRIFVYTWQGFLPRHRQYMANKIGKYAAEELAGMPDIDQKDSRPQKF